MCQCLGADLSKISSEEAKRLVGHCRLDKDPIMTEGAIWVRNVHRDEKYSRAEQIEISLPVAAGTCVIIHGHAVGHFDGERAYFTGARGTGIPRMGVQPLFGSGDFDFLYAVGTRCQIVPGSLEAIIKFGSGRRWEIVCLSRWSYGSGLWRRQIRVV